MADKISYEIVDELGVLSTDYRGWTLEVNRISWNHGAVKYDIRKWAPGREKMGKGVTLTDDEATELVAILS